MSQSLLDLREAHRPVQVTRPKGQEAEEHMGKAQSEWPPLGWKTTPQASAAESLPLGEAVRVERTNIRAHCPQELGGYVPFAHPLKKIPRKISQEKYEVRKTITTLLYHNGCWVFTTTWGSKVNSIFPVCKCWRSSLGISGKIILISCDNMFNLHLLQVQQEHLWCKHTLCPSAILWCLKMRDQA